MADSIFVVPFRFSFSSFSVTSLIKKQKRKKRKTTCPNLTLDLKFKKKKENFGLRSFLLFSHLNSNANQERQKTAFIEQFPRSET